MTRQDVIDAMNAFDQQFADSKEYESWLASTSRRFLVQNDRHYYPPTQLLGLAIGINTIESNNDEQINRVFRDLGFEVVQLSGARLSLGILASLRRRIKGLFVGRKSESDHDVGASNVPDFSAQNSALEADRAHSNPVEDTLSDAAHIPQVAAVNTSIAASEEEHITELPSGFTVWQKQNSSNVLNESSDVSSIDWSHVPVTILTSRLVLRGGGGAQTARIIRVRQCRTVADVMKISDEQWLRHNGYGPNALHILHEELAALLATPISNVMAQAETHRETQSDDASGNSVATNQKQDDAVRQDDLDSYYAPRPISGATASPLDDPNWYPRTWSDLTSLLHVYGHNRLALIPVEGLISNLRATPEGIEVANIISHHCNSIAELLAGNPSASGTNSYLTTLDTSQLRLLKNAVTNYLRSELTEQVRSSKANEALAHSAIDTQRAEPGSHLRNRESDKASALSSTNFRHVMPEEQIRINETDKSSMRPKADPQRLDPYPQEQNNRTGTLPGFPSTNSTQDEPSEQSFLAPTLWEQIKNKLQNPKPERLKSVLLIDIAYDIQNVRARNALLRRLPKNFSLFDLVMMKDENFLELPNLGVKSLEALKFELIDLLNQLLQIDGAIQQPPLPLDATTTNGLTDFTEIECPDGILRRYLHQGSTLWDQIRPQLHFVDADRLKSVFFHDIARNIQNARVKNALWDSLPTGCSVYDLLMFTEERLLAIPFIGAKGLDVLKQEMITILNHLWPVGAMAQQAKLLLDYPDVAPDVDAKVTVSQSYDWHGIRQLIEKIMSPREIEILQAYYGHQQVGETLATIGARLDLTRERVRQIKSKASSKFRAHIPAEIAARAFHDHALAKLTQAGAEVTPAVLWTALEDPRVVTKDELWLLNWFEDMYGRDWYVRWILANGAPDQNKFQAIAGLAGVSAVVRFLSTCTYRPLSLEEALVIAQVTEPTINAYDLRLQLEEHPEVRLFTHGDLQIGHASWRWFNPRRARETRQVEWALRLMHVPASAGEIAQAVRAQLGVMDVSAFGVADACDRNPEIFFQQGDAYGLVIWKRASELRQPLMDLLTNGPLSFPEIVDLWQRRYGSSSEAELVFAALHHCQDSFCSVKPLYWARKDVGSTSYDDPTLFSFENLMPTL